MQKAKSEKTQAEKRKAAIKGYQPSDGWQPLNRTYFFILITLTFHSSGPF
jgi:hypothetical protein